MRNYSVEVWWNPGDGYRWHCVAAGQLESEAIQLARHWQSRRAMKSRVVTAP